MMSVTTHVEQNSYTTSEWLTREVKNAEIDHLIAEHTDLKRTYLALQCESWSFVVASSFCALYLKPTRIPTWVYGVATFVHLGIIFNSGYGNKKNFHAEFIEDMQFMKSMYNSYPPNNIVRTSLLHNVSNNHYSMLVTQQANGSIISQYKRSGTLHSPEKKIKFHTKNVYS